MPVYEKCQIFTPSDNVKKLLNVVGYNENLFGKKVAENSCGDGNILQEIVKRYIEDCINNKMSLNQISIGLKEDIWAAEIDENHRYKCIERLDSLAKTYGISNISWNIFNGDSLKNYDKNTFDFVIGNPPYITYRELDVNEREFVKSEFETCSEGKFDYCYAFIEAGLRSLKGNGKLAYLIPSNIFKNRFAEKLRAYILPYLTDIYDYKNQKLFSGRLTSSAIMVCDRGSNNHSLTYHNLSEETLTNLSKSSLSEKWIFSDTLPQQDGETIRFGDFFHAASSIATLLNKVYIITNYTQDNELTQTDGYQIENKLIRKAVSPRSLNYQKEELLLFPYQYNEEGLQKYTAQEFENNFPKATAYLKAHQQALKDRNSDKGIEWFEYGRSQALTHLNQPKLLISTLVTGNAKVYLLDNETIPTSGLYIVPVNNQIQYTLEQAKQILESNSFLQYAQSIGVISNGNSYRISPKDINNFTFPLKMLL